MGQSDSSGNHEVKNIALELYRLGFNVVPVDKTKKPLTHWSPNERVPKDELIRALNNATGVAIVAGPKNPFEKAGTHLLLVDVDDVSVLEKTQLLKELIGQTAHWHTGPRCPRCGEKHIEVVEFGKRFKCPKCGTEFTAEEAKRGLGAMFWVPLSVREKYLNRTIRGPIEFLINNYQLVPPSLHPSGIKYEWVVPIDPNKPNLGVYALTEAEVEAILNEVAKAGGNQSEETEVKRAEVESGGGLRELTDDEINQIISLLKEAYRPGQRQTLALYLSGLFAKERVHPISAVKVIKGLYDATGDEDPLKTRLATIVYSYKKAGINIDEFASAIEQLTGVKPYGIERHIGDAEVKGRSGVEEILRQTFGDKKASEIITALDKILGHIRPKPLAINALDPNPNIPIPEYCLEFYHIGGYCEKSLLVTKNGVYVVSYDEHTNEKGVKEVTIAKSKPVLYGYIQRVANVQLKGVTTEEQLIKLVINGKELIGTPSEVVDNLKDAGVEYYLKPSITRLFLVNAVDIEEMFYSAGPWVVGNRIEIAEKPGYKPDWKDNITYRLLDGGNPGKGIKLIADIVNAFGNPNKAVTVISYGLIAWAKHFFVDRFHYFPHLVISGPAEVGKSLLVDVLRVLYNFPEEERSPKSDYQLRKILAKTTIPGLLTEGNFLVSETSSNDRLLSTLVASATSNVLMESGGSEYGGLFLAVRSLIIPTNLDVDSLPAYVRDKLIIIYISKEEGFTENPAISTPRRMSDQDKLDVHAVFKEALRLFEAKLPEIIQGLSRTTRENAIKFYISLGYSILKEIANRYGVALPEPFVPSLVEAEEDFNEIVRSAFTQFLDEKIRSLIRDGTLYFVNPSDVKGALDRYGFFYDIEARAIIFKMSLLTEFSTELARRFGVSKLSWKTIAEILGVKRTRLSRYGTVLNNVFEFKLETPLTPVNNPQDNKTLLDAIKEDLSGKCVTLEYLKELLGQEKAHSLVVFAEEKGLAYWRKDDNNGLCLQFK